MDLNTFYIGDSVQVMKENIPDNFVDLTVTSPPYDNLRTYKGFTFDYQSMLKELWRVTKVGGVVVWVVGDQTIKGCETGTSFRQALYGMECGFNLHDTMIWYKTTIPLSHNRYEQSFEYMFIFSKGKPKTFNGIRTAYSENTIKRIKSGDAYSYKNRNGNKQERPIKSKKRILNPNGTLKKNVWEILPDIFTTKNEQYLKKHPARFPEQLATDHILSWSNEGNTILDPMCGSGTTCKMAWLNKRRFIGIDCSEEYVNKICIPRLEKYGWIDQ